MDDDAPSFSGHKLCGFLCAVLTVNSPNLPETPPFATRFYITETDVNFTSQNGVVLSPIGEIPSADVSDSVAESEKSVAEAVSPSPKKIGIRKGGRRSIGLVRGSISVVHQLHALVMNKCLMIDARLVRVEDGGVGGCEVRAVLLVDVYLPIALLSGSQFPRSGSIAGALFRHLRCHLHPSLLCSFRNPYVYFTHTRRD